MLERVLHGHVRFPVQIVHGVGNFRHAVLHILIAFTVIRAGGGLHRFHFGGGVAILGISHGQVQHHLRQFFHREIIDWVADIVDLAAGNLIFVGDDFHQGVDAIVDVSEGAFLRAAVHQLDVFAAHDVAEKLRNHARAAFLSGKDAVQPGADPVEGAEQSEIQRALHAVGPNHAVHQLLAARVNPARFVDRAINHIRGFRIEFRVIAHAIGFRRGRKQHALTVLHAVTNDGQVGFEIEFEYLERFFNVSGGGSDGHQR